MRAFIFKFFQLPVQGILLFHFTAAICLFRISICKILTGRYHILLKYLSSWRLLAEIIFYNIHLYSPVGKKGNAISLLICINDRRHHLLSIIYESFYTETI